MHAIFQIKLTEEEAAPGGHDTRYRFRNKYLDILRNALDDWIIYYQPAPRAGKPVIGSTGYFAIARVTLAQPSRLYPEYSEAMLERYEVLPNAVPFSILNSQFSSKSYFETSMLQSDGRMNSHTVQQQVRALSVEDYTRIIDTGFRPHRSEEELQIVLTPLFGFAEDPPESVERDRILTSRTFRDRVFRELVGKAYNMRCAMTGMSMQAADGSYEIEYAHIKPIECSGPDSINNGIALSRCMHWLFDKGLISIDPEYRIIKSSRCNEPKISNLINESGKITLPKNISHCPHPEFLRYHRECIFQQ